MNTCCHPECDLPAVYDIREVGTTRLAGVDDDTYACASHLESMMGHAGEPLPGRTVQYVVTPIEP